MFPFLFPNISKGIISNRLRDTLFMTVILSFVLSPSLLAEEQSQFFTDESRKWLRENQKQFQLITLGKEDGPFAKIHRFTKKGVQFKGAHFYGYRFQAPDWLENESLLWMLSIEGFKPQGPRMEWDKDWSIVSISEEGAIGQFQYQKGDFDPSRFTVYKERFPDRTHFVKTSTLLDEIKGGETYLAVIASKDEEISSTASAFTFGSDRGAIEYGMLPTAYSDGGPGKAFQTVFDEKPKSPDYIVVTGHKIFQKSGAEACKEHFDREVERFVDRGGSFKALYTRIWNAAQYGAGRTSKPWAAFCFDYLLWKCWDYKAYMSATNLTPNTSMALTALHRLESAEQAFTPFLFEWKRRGYSTDLSKYREIETPFPTFPEIKTRYVRAKSYTTIAAVDQWGFADSHKGLYISHVHAATLLSWARLKHLTGHWKAALEWQLAVAELTKELKGFGTDPEVDNIYMEARLDAADSLMSLGFIDEAHEIFVELVASEGIQKMAYNGRSYYRAAISAIDCRNQLGLTSGRDIIEIKELDEKFRSLATVMTNFAEWSRFVRIKVDLSAGDSADHLEDLRELAKKDNYMKARLALISYQLEKNILAGMENDLISLLKDYRKLGYKIAEWEIYSLYSQFLSKEGRFRESIKMQREALRLTQLFDLFPFEAVARFDLANLLERDPTTLEEAKLQKKLALNILSGESSHSPSRLSGSHLKRLESRFTRNVIQTTPNPRKIERAGQVFLQPSQSVILPIDGFVAKGKLTLGNSSEKAISGHLAVTGIEKVKMTYLKENLEVTVDLGALEKSSHIPLILPPSEQILISISELEQESFSGPLEIAWISDGPRLTSKLEFNTQDREFSSALIDSGDYTLNEFHGATIYHHYQTLNNTDSEIEDFRVRASMGARIEGYSLSGELLFVDDNGNGSFLDPGDSVSRDENRSSYADFPLLNGEAVIHLEVFPKGAIPKEGIEIIVESKDGDVWRALGVNKILSPN